jgi:hypothetical protein
MVVLGAPWVKSRPASRTRIFAANILDNRQSLPTFSAEYRLVLALVLAPNHRCVPSQLLVAMNAGIKRVAALEFHSHNIAVRLVVRTLSVLIDAGTAHHHRTCDYAFFCGLSSVLTNKSRNCSKSKGHEHLHEPGPFRIRQAASSISNASYRRASYSALAPLHRIFPKNFEPAI